MVLMDHLSPDQGVPETLVYQSLRETFISIIVGIVHRLSADLWVQCHHENMPI